MTISHLWQKNQGGSFYYKRRYPKAVCEILGLSRSAIKAICLNTTDTKAAAKLALKHAAHDDAEWSRLIKGEVSATRKVATEYLESFGVSPSNPQSTPDNTDLLIDHIRTFISEDDEQRIYDDEIDDPASVLPPLQAAALRMAQGLFMASDALTFYLEMSGEGKAKTFSKIPKIAFAKLIESCGDKPVTSYRRADVRKLIEDMRKSGNSTSTVRRQLNSLVAAFSLVIRERELVYTNPFIKAVIPGEGLDVEEREVLTPVEFSTLSAKVDASGNRDDLSHMLGILMDTGARLAEIVGLLVSDVCLDGPVPYLKVLHHPHRRLKNDDSIRTIPLTGRALASAKKAVTHAHMLRSEVLFSRYTNKDECRATIASQTLNKRLRAFEVEKTCHCLRHTMRDRLRAVECPEAIIVLICSQS